MDQKSIHIVTSMGGAYVSGGDVVALKAFEYSEKYARSKFGFVPQSTVFSKDGSQAYARASAAELIKTLGFVEIPEDKIAFNPNLFYTIDIFDSKKDDSLKKDRFSSFLICQNGSPVRPGAREARIALVTLPKILERLLPNAIRSEAATRADGSNLKLTPT